MPLPPVDLGISCQAAAQAVLTLLKADRCVVVGNGSIGHLLVTFSSQP